MMSPGPGMRMPPPNAMMTPDMLRMIPPEMLRMRMPNQEALQQAPAELQNMLRSVNPEMLKMIGNGRSQGMPPALRPGMIPRGPSPPIEFLLPPQLLQVLSETIQTEEKDSELTEKWEERQSGVRLLQTMCKLIAGKLS